MRHTNAPLRCASAGSVDDGKSTLVGRLLFDSKSLMTDQIAHVMDVSKRRGLARTDLALVTDGLRAEREQGITIDVAWRYFATPRRRFVLADSPGHVQYTRNTVTACSNADAAIVLVDARRGPSEQTRRHLFVARLLGVRSLVLAVNKMDAVGWSLDAFARVRDDVATWLAALPPWLRPVDTAFVPVSALTGDNVVAPSRAMPWYDGPALLAHLEGLPSDEAGADAPARLPVQWVIRPQSHEHPDYRGYAGRIASGSLAVGAQVRVLPSGHATRITRLETARGDVAGAQAGESVVVHLADDLDVGRGDLLVSGMGPEPARTIALDVAWVHPSEAKAGDPIVIKHGTREVRGIIEAIDARYDVATGMEIADGAPLGLNALGRVRLRASEPVCVDRYRDVRSTGSVLLIDPASGATLAGGMCR